MRLPGLLFALLVLFASGDAQVARAMQGSGPVLVGDLVVKGAWARPTVGSSRLTAVYLTIVNNGKAADKLVGAASPSAGTAELHTHVRSGGTMKMRAVTEIAIAAGETASLEPGGDHIMLIDLTSALEAGDTLDLTLTFEAAGSVDITVPVLAHDDGDHGDHGH